MGGSPPEALLNDLAPAQVAGDRIAGFYRTADYHPGAEDSRHVEGYSWGGLTSRSSWRVLWLLLLPFLLGNLAGWMCSANIKKNSGSARLRFRLHHASAALACLALTINFVLVVTMITADVGAYQASRAGDTKVRWWLAPLRWSLISAHPARQVLLGVVVPLVIVILLAALSRLSRTRYESVRPPYKVAAKPSSRARTAAATLDGGLSHKDFWDGEHNVRHAARRHVAASVAFLALVLAITSRQTVTADAGTVRAGALWWAAVLSGAVVIALVIVRTCADGTRAASLDSGSTVTLLAVAFAAIVCAGVFAWVQPAVTAQAGQLPGMAGIVLWTMAGAGATIGLVLLASIAAGKERGTLLCGPLVSTILAFALLNATMLGALINIAHLIGSLTFAANAESAQIYVPDLIGFGTVAVMIATLITALSFGIFEAIWWWHGRDRTSIRTRYDQEEAQRRGVWWVSAMHPPAGEDKAAGDKWVRRIARADRLGHASRDAGWFFWALSAFDVAAVVFTITMHPEIGLNGWFGKVTFTIGTALPLFLVGLLRTGWAQEPKRRHIGVLWDIGTFWPRSYHPLAPPCYAERAVPDLQRRLWWLHDNGGSVVLAAHSQGSVLAAAALIQENCLPAKDRIGLITFGCPLIKLYAWGFPAYVSTDMLSKDLLKAGGGVDKRPWRNIHYPTDPIGGHIFDGEQDDSQLSADPRDVAARLDRATVDLELYDPAGSWYLYGQPTPSPGGHSGYWTDARVWCQVDEIATETVTPPGDEARRDDSQ
jgi:hypothetical protein